MTLMKDAVRKDSLKTSQGTVGWRSPSNIALVKYWGKRPIQIPANPSVSLTLSTSHTDTYCDFRLKKEASDDICLSFEFEGKENLAFGQKIQKWLTSVANQMPWLTWFDFNFKSSNSFPHSAGIASSACLD